MYKPEKMGTMSGKAYLPKEKGPIKKQIHRSFRRISDIDLVRIVEIIRNWTAIAITWEAVCLELQVKLGHLWTRQSLDKHPMIREAFKARKRSELATPTHQGMDQVVERLREEVKELRVVRLRYQELFVQLIYNANVLAKVPIEELEKPLPYSVRLREIPKQPPPNVEIPLEVKTKVAQLLNKRRGL